MSKFADIFTIILIIAGLFFYLDDEMMATYLTMAAAMVMLMVRDAIDDREYFANRVKQINQRRADRLKSAN